MVITNEQPTVITTQPAEPVAKGETPQKVYDKKKTIFRSNQVIWYLLGIVEVLLGFRIILKVLGANAASGFTNLIYSLSDILVLPFRGIFRVGVSGGSVIEPSALVAIVVYLILAWGLVYLLNFINPITPEKVESEGV